MSRERMGKEKRWNPAGVQALLNGDIENANVAFTPGGIERQEAEGQKTFVESELIPTEGNPNIFKNNSEWIEKLESFGFEIDKSKVIDDLFYSAKLPEGWKKRATEHSMWSEIVDSSGKVMVLIFYKAAFYDRRAFGNID